jgi:urease accessory protein
MLRATRIVTNPSGPFADEVILDYEDRHRRRLLLCGVGGTEFLLDLADVPDLRGGDAIALASGALVHVRAADEPLMEVRCGDNLQLARIAWHVGNRHLAAEIAHGSLRLRADHVIADMIAGLGGEVRYFNAPFNPEGGAYEKRGVVPQRGRANHPHAGTHYHE